MLRPSQVGGSGLTPWRALLEHRPGLGISVVSPGSHQYTSFYIVDIKAICYSEDLRSSSGY